MIIVHYYSIYNAAIIIQILSEMKVLDKEMLTLPRMWDFFEQSMHGTSKGHDGFWYV